MCDALNVLFIRGESVWVVEESVYVRSFINLNESLYESTGESAKEWLSKEQHPLIPVTSCSLAKLTLDVVTD